MLNCRVVVVVFSETKENLIRIISLRKALSQERSNYEKYLENELGSN